MAQLNEVIMVMGLYCDTWPTHYLIGSLHKDRLHSLSEELDWADWDKSSGLWTLIRPYPSILELGS